MEYRNLFVRKGGSYCYFFLFFFLFFFPSSAMAFDFFSGYGRSNECTSLDALCDQIAGDFRKMSTSSTSDFPLNLYKKRNNIMETQGKLYDFSNILERKLEHSFSKLNYQFVDTLDSAGYIVHAEYTKLQDSVEITLTCRKTNTKETAFQRIGGYKINLKYLPEEYFHRKLSRYIDEIANDLIRKLSENAVKTLYIKPIVEYRKKYVCEFSEYLFVEMKTLLAHKSHFKILDSGKIYELSRGFSREKIKIENIHSATAESCHADATLEGMYCIMDKELQLHFSVKNERGNTFYAAKKLIPLEIITFNIMNASAEATAVIGDTENASINSHTRVAITTNKGDNHQIYYTGEEIVFNIMVEKQPLYIYLYNIKPDKTIGLLYPGEGDCIQKLLPGMPTHIPPVSADWKIEVCPPYGMDLIKVFATDALVPIPHFDANSPSRSFDKDDQWLTRKRNVAQQKYDTQQPINSLDLVDYFRTVCKEKGIKLYENHIVIETREKN